MDTIDGVEFKTCKELDHSPKMTLSGEEITFGCYGHALDIFPYEIESKEEYHEIIGGH